ncbi:6,7-dimethyl-8-ribityllumazine synthase [Candidatus Gracilibacteria bacterium]|nr:6,7-dimethyl-8-ribityllumazine synthase [Candidatus Gracilibacteria bacterium]
MILILTSEFYPDITGELERAVITELEKNNESYEVIKVPGAVELPITAQRILQKKCHDTVIALGCVIQGETDHYEYVMRSCTDGLTRVSLDMSIPIIQGVLACRNRAQAEDRKTRKGQEFAQTALTMKKLFSTS